jgi:hypothetical protein
MTKAMGWVYKILIGIVLFCVIGFSGFYLFNEFWPYSEGTRTGKIIKFSRKGIIFKTWEGEINQGLGIEKFAFSVKEDEIIKKIEANQGKENVYLKYEEKFVKFFWHGDTKYYIIDCIPAK